VSENLGDGEKYVRDVEAGMKQQTDEGIEEDL
jgi:hypothetical protein